MCYNDYGDTMTDLEIDAYYNQIMECSLEKISKILPNKSVYGFEDAMEAIIDRLQIDLDTFKSFLEENLSEEESQSTLYEIDELQKKIEVCNEYLYENEELKQRQRIILAKTEAGNFYFESDFKNVKREKYDELQKIMAFIYGDREEKSTYYKIMTNNAKLRGVIEYKTSKDQLRVYAKRIKGDIIYVFGIVTKKDDWTKQINETLNSRINNVNISLTKIKKINGEEELKKLLKESKTTLDNIMEVLNDSNNKQAIEEITKDKIYDNEEEIEILDISDELDEVLEFERQKLQQEEWNNYYNVAREIYDEKGFVDLRDPRAKKIELGFWLDYQIDSALNEELTSDRKGKLLSLVSSKKTRKEEFPLPKHDNKLTR